jgi:DNA helicase-2/ATP-dependent DNA helicase PcrA
VQLFDTESADTADPAESPLFADLNPTQREAVAATEGPLLVVAGAGSGKTRVLTYRIAHLVRDLGVPPSAILAITFTNKAADEMKERVGRLVGGAVRSMWVSTFHSACVRILRREAPRLGYRSAFTIYDSQDSQRAVSLAVKDLNLDPKKFPPKTIKATISAAKNELIDYETFGSQGTGFYHENIADVYRLYQQRMVEASAMDFDDLLMVTAELFGAFPDVLEHYQERFRYIMVDEYQDTNHAQYQLVKMLAAAHRNVCVVGDGDQCLPADTQISTPGGSVRIADLAEGDAVMGIGGHGRVGEGVVTKVKRSTHTGSMYRVTAGDRMVEGTPHHVVPARLDDLDGSHVVYLMYRADKGYRVGLTRTFRQNARGKRDIGLRVRTNQEHADAAWVLKVCESRAEAGFWEARLSSEYGLPTTCFHAMGRDLAMDQPWIDRLYGEVDTELAAKWLMQDLDLHPEYPHHRPQNGVRRQTLNLTMFADRRNQGIGYHRVQWSSNRSDIAGKLRAAGFSIRPGKLDGTWRLETSRKNYAEALRFAKDAADAGGLQISRRVSIDGTIYDETPLSHLRPGMTVLEVEDGRAIERRVDGVEISEGFGDVYDIEVQPQHTYVANGIIVHNSVYKFRGADIRNILHFEQDYEEARLVVLDQNYRSTETILDAANAVISNNSRRKPKRLWTDVGTGVPIIRYEAQDEHDEAGFIADTINALEDQGEPHVNSAIFYRTNAQSRVVEEVLMRYGIPYNVIGSVRFYERREIKDVLAYLRTIANPDDPISVKRIVNVPKRGIGDTSMGHVDRHAENMGITFFEALRQADQVNGLNNRAVNAIKDFVAVIDELVTVANESGPTAAVQAVYDLTGYLATFEAEQTIEALGRAENLRELLSGTEEFENASEGGIVNGEEWDEMDGRRRLELFLESVSLIADIDDMEDKSQAVTLMTLHNAKGLEFPNVFIVGMEDGVFPHLRSLGDPDELEEERRLCYVGLTRAEKRLYLTSAWARMLFGSTNYNPPSRFIKEIPGHLIEEAGKRQRQPSKERIDGPLETVSSDEIQPGDRVLHAKWGKGTVQIVNGTGDRAEAQIDFDKLGRKRLLLAWAPLEKV